MDRAVCDGYVRVRAESNNRRAFAGKITGIAAIRIGQHGDLRVGNVVIGVVHQNAIVSGFAVADHDPGSGPAIIRPRSNTVGCRLFFVDPVRSYIQCCVISVIITINAIRVGAAHRPGSELPFRVALLPAGRITGSTAGSARTTRLTIRFFRRRTAGTAGESALRHFRGHAFSDSVSHLGRLTGVGIGIFSKCCQRAAQDKHCRKYDRKISFHSETSFSYRPGDAGSFRG